MMNATEFGFFFAFAFYFFLLLSSSLGDDLLPGINWIGSLHPPGRSCLLSVESTRAKEHDGNPLEQVTTTKTI
ncbi:hypothetical protein P170DRAFT_148168 [Aspergillus steynii IBT 23096]|uniref:Secreted protein n=1 Tax=Aspergillus steynii IBT 23096 TaxID=1392250 RepID=A0A2I2GCF4_9EURO|nr:uncharacterized protein P170DRAFT_148168 [Aspergillus steynii IBT 23096]PLB50552.1 hypothetical protein P170DRAFT_148168 [Aspergillus steynii IBT 23096]